MKLQKELIFLFLIVILAGFLRLYKLDQNPPSPYWAEAAIGFDSWSILKTTKDHHGNICPITAFQSFGDYKPSFYFYLNTISEAIFGLNTFAVRLPSALAGIGTVIAVYFLILITFREHRSVQSLALISSLLLAIVPWHILISRVGFETNVSFFLDVLGLYLFIKFLKQKSPKIYVLFLSFIFWALSIYTYHSARVFIPLLILSLIFIYREKAWQQKKQTLLSGIIFVLFLIPLIVKISSPEIRQRFNETSALATLEPVLASNAAIASDGGSRVAKLIHHRYWYYGKILVQNYLSHFDYNFLFLNGDQNYRHSIGLVGQLYWIYAPLILLGLYFYIRKKEKNLTPILTFTLLAPIPAALTTGTPHALRTLPMVLGLVVLAAYGFINIWEKIEKKKNLNKFLATFFSLILLFHLTQFWHYYWHTYRNKYAGQWQYGYQELMHYVGQVRLNYDAVLMTRDYGRPAMYYWFYNQIDPELVQKWNSIYPKDQGEYLQFENIYFGINPNIMGKRLQIETKEMLDASLIKTVNNLDGKPVFYIYETL